MIKASQEDGEVILFKTPSESSTLFVANISLGVTEAQLRERFEDYGLIYNLRLYDRDKEGQTVNNSQYAFVQYYAILHAKKAFAYLKGVVMDGKILKITFAKSNRSTPAAFQERELNIEKCFEMANYFIGYNKWSSSLVSLERVELTSDNGQYRAHFKCIIRHILREKGDYVDGEGEGSELSNEMGVALDYAKKKSRYRCA